MGTAADGLHLPFYLQLSRNKCKVGINKDKHKLTIGGERIICIETVIEAGATCIETGVPGAPLPPVLVTAWLFISVSPLSTSSMTDISSSNTHSSNPKKPSISKRRLSSSFMSRLICLVIVPTARLYSNSCAYLWYVMNSTIIILINFFFL